MVADAWYACGVVVVGNFVAKACLACGVFFVRNVAAGACPACGVGVVGNLVARACLACGAVVVGNLIAHAWHASGVAVKWHFIARAAYACVLLRVWNLVICAYRTVPHVPAVIADCVVGAGSACLAAGLHLTVRTNAFGKSVVWNFVAFAGTAFRYKIGISAVWTSRLVQSKILGAGDMTCPRAVRIACLTSPSGIYLGFFLGDSKTYI